MDRKNTALTLAQYGFSVFPTKPGAKAPLLKGGFYNATTDLETIERWYTETPDANIGLVCGDQSEYRGVVGGVNRKGERWKEPGTFYAISGIDDDSGKYPESKSAIDMFEEETGVKFQRDTLNFTTGNGGRTYLFLDPDCIFDRPIVNRELHCDPRGSGCYTLVPDSFLFKFEDTGNGLYYWNDNTGLKTATDEVEGEFLRWMDSKHSNNTPSRVGVHTKTHEVREYTNYVYPQQILEGERNTTLHAIGSSLIGHGFDDNVWPQLLQILNENLCQPVYEGNDMRALEASLSRYEIGEGKWLKDNDHVNGLRNFLFWCQQKGIDSRIVREMFYVVNEECFDGVVDHDYVTRFMNDFYMSRNLVKMVIEDD